MTNETFTPYELELLAQISEQQAEIEVLTTERDNALLRIEELERRLDYAWMPTDDDKGGVNPNA